MKAEMIVELSSMCGSLIFGMNEPLKIGDRQSLITREGRYGFVQAF